MTDTEERPNISTEEATIILELQRLTAEGKRVKTEAAQIADQRRQQLLALKARGWSMRKIGETINVSGQRIDSMIKIASGSRPRKQKKVAANAATVAEN